MHFHLSSQRRESAGINRVLSRGDSAMRVYFTTARLRLSAPLKTGIAAIGARSVHFQTLFGGQSFKHRDTNGSPCVASSGKFFQDQPSAVSNSP